ncbi:uncharacterized protein C14orf119-like [Watersipora subatra]|uniref:uncharacterized protein C14orf119-like n=1 Tax=Watersipora subatra TaxID=2589382 RepID=UPI00355BCC0A
MGDSSTHGNEVRCILHWFSSWKQWDKEQFFKQLLDKAVPSNVDTMLDAMNSITVKDKPPSILQCQLKLFNQWFDTWSGIDKQMLYEGLTEADPAFMILLNESVFVQSTRLS